MNEKIFEEHSKWLKFMDNEFADLVSVYTLETEIRAGMIPKKRMPFDMGKLIATEECYIDGFGDKHCFRDNLDEWKIRALIFMTGKCDFISTTFFFLP